MIDPKITAFCARQGEAFKNDVPIPQLSPTPHPWSMTPEAATPSRQHAFHDRKAKRLVPAYISPYNSPNASDSDGRWSTATPSPTSSPSQTPMTTPGPRWQHAFTPINKPRLVPRSVPYPERRLPSPKDILQQSEQAHAYSTSYTRPVFPLTPPSTGRISSPEISPRTIPAEIPKRTREANRDGQAPVLGAEESEWLRARVRPEEEYAAYILLAMKLGNQTPAQAAQGLGISYADIR